MHRRIEVCKQTVTYMMLLKYNVVSLVAEESFGVCYISAVAEELISLMLLRNNNVLNVPQPRRARRRGGLGLLS